MAQKSLDWTLDWSTRSRADLGVIVKFYAREASAYVAEEAYLAIEAAAETISASPYAYREGVRSGTREYVMRRFPYTLIFRVVDDTVTIVRVMHQAAKYFN